VVLRGISDGEVRMRPNILTPKKSNTRKQDPKKVQRPKIVTPKKSNFSPHKIENGRISFLSTPQKVLDKIFISKKVHQKNENPKKVPSREFQTQKKPSHLPVTDTPEYPPGIIQHSTAAHIASITYKNNNITYIIKS